MSKTRLLYFICAGLLFIAIAHLPIGYYTFLRIAVSIVAIYGIIKDYSGKLNYSNITLGIIAILFNPIFPIYLYQKSIWIPIDLITGCLFIIKAFNVKQSENAKDE